MAQSVEQSAAEILALLTGAAQGQNQSLEAQFEAIRDALQAALGGGGGGGGGATPTLAEVLGEGNDAGGADIEGIGHLTATDYLSVGTLVGGQAAVPQLILRASETQDEDPFTNIMEVYDPEGDLVAAFDWGGTLDLARGFHVSDPVGSVGGVQVSSNGSIQSFSAQPQAFAVKTADGSQGFLTINTSGAGSAITTIAAPTANQVLLELASFGGAADAIYYGGPPDYAGEFRVLAGGAIVTGQYSAPADGALVANQLALWFDSSNGASKAMFKGKSADGTVVAGALALT